MVTISSMLVSCIVPAYNSEKYLEETLESIFSQSYSNLEVIVVDDGSTDGSSELLGRYSGQLTLLQQKHSGPSSARNLGIKAARGDMIAFLDSDDLWEPDKISLQVKLLVENSDLDVCFTQVKNFWMPEVEDLKNFYQQNSLLKIVPPYHLCSLVARASVFERVGVFNPSMTIGEDADLFKRMKEARIDNVVIPQNLVKRRLHKNNTSINLNLIKKDTLVQIAKNSRLKILNKNQQKDPVSSKAELILSKLHSMTYDEDFYYLIANNIIRLRFAQGEHAQSFTKALKHLMIKPPIDSKDVELDIHISNFDLSSVSFPPPESYLTDGNFFLEYSDLQKNISILNLQENRAYHLLAPDYKISQGEMGAPFCRILRWWFRKKELQLIHGAVVGSGLRGVLIPGRGGSGKSTISIACLKAGLSFLSEDFCLLELNSPMKAYSLYRSAKLFTKDLDLDSTLMEDLKVDTKSKKSLFFIDPHKVQPEMSIEAIFLPVIQPSTKSGLVKISPFVALRELATSTLFQMKGSRSYDFHAVENLVKQVPCYQFNMGSDLRNATEVIREFL